MKNKRRLALCIIMALCLIFTMVPFSSYGVTAKTLTYKNYYRQQFWYDTNFSGNGTATYVFKATPKQAGRYDFNMGSVPCKASKVVIKGSDGSVPTVKSSLYNYKDGKKYGVDGEWIGIKAGVTYTITVTMRSKIYSSTKGMYASFDYCSCRFMGWADKHPSFKYVSRMKATTSATGYKGYYKCSKCGMIVTKDGKAVATKVAIPRIDWNTCTVATAYYTGSPVKPAVTIKDVKGHKLVSGTDYSVTYSDNTEVGDKATATVTFKGNYSGTRSKYFTINKGSQKFVNGADKEIKLTEGKSCTINTSVKYETDFVEVYCSVNPKKTSMVDVDEGIDGKWQIQGIAATDIPVVVTVLAHANAHYKAATKYYYVTVTAPEQQDPPPTE